MTFRTPCTQIESSTIKIYMEGQELDMVNKFKYLGFTWTRKMSLKSTIDHYLEKTEKALAKLKWLKQGRKISISVLRQCLFAYVFPHLAWIFSFIPMTQREALDRKLLVAIRIVHRCQYVSADDLFMITNEKLLEIYAQR